MQKRISRKLVIACAALTVLLLGGVVMPLASAMAQDGAGQRMFQDDRITTNEPKKRIRIQREVQPRPAGDSAASEPAAEEGGNPEPAAEDQGDAPPPRPDASAVEDVDDDHTGLRQREVMDEDELERMMEEREEAIEDAADELDDDAVRADPTLGEERFDRIACQKVCERMDDQSACLSKCNRSGVCSVGFIDCE